MIMKAPRVYHIGEWYEFLLMNLLVLSGLLLQIEITIFSNCGRSKSRYFPVGTIFSTIFLRFLGATFKLRIQCPCNRHGARLLYNSDSYVAFERKKYIIVCFSDQIPLFLQPLSQLRFLFTNELSTAGIVVLCSDEKCINVCHEKSTLKLRQRFFKNRIEIYRK